MIKAADFKGMEFVNYENIDLEDLKGKVVLLDFWTFCCVNCIRVLPDLAMLERVFSDELVVIGVHSAKFPHEKESKAIKDAIARHKMAHIVINDKDMKLWEQYCIRAWPTFVIIDPKGYEAARFSGEGNYDLLHQTISELIAKHDIDRDKHFLPLPDGAEETMLRFPSKVSVHNEKLYISNSGKDEVLIANLDGVVTDVIHELHDPQGVAVYGDRVYIANAGSDEVIYVEKMIEREPFFARISTPMDIAINGDQMAVAVSGRHMLVGYDLKKQELYRVAGTGRENLTDGETADLAQPSSVRFDGDRLYFADSETSSVRFVENGVTTTLIGSGLFDFGDSEEMLQHPLAIEIYNGSVLIADTYNGKIKQLDLITKKAKTILDGLKEPSGLAVHNDKLYIANSAAHEIVVLDLITLEKSVLDVRIEREPNRNYKRRAEDGGM